MNKFVANQSQSLYLFSTFGRQDGLSKAMYLTEIASKVEQAIFVAKITFDGMW